MGSETAIDILLVEDSAAGAKLATRSLRKSRFSNSIEWVKDGAAALDDLFCRGDYASRPCGNPRLVLLDLGMPKVSGLEVQQQMRADARTRLVPVAFEEFSRTVGKLGLYWPLVNSAPPQHIDASGR